MEAGPPLIFVSDASAEADQLTKALREHGYRVVDVPLSMLVNRVAVQRPRLILCDVDADLALETTHRLRHVPGGSGVDLIFIGEAGRTLEEMADAVIHESSGFFVRPVDTFALLRKVEALIGAPPNKLGAARISQFPSDISGRPGSFPPAPISAPPSSNPLSQSPRRGELSKFPRRMSPWPRLSEKPSSHSNGNAQEGPTSSRRPEYRSPLLSDSLPPISSQPPAASPESPIPSLALDVQLDPDATSEPDFESMVHASLSPDLSELLAKAEERISSHPSSLGSSTNSSTPPLVPFVLSPEDEVDAILPPAVLASLDEPLDDFDDGDDSSIDSRSGPLTRSGSEVEPLASAAQHTGPLQREPSSATAERNPQSVTGNQLEPAQHPAPIPGYHSSAAGHSGAAGPPPGASLHSAQTAAPPAIAGQKYLNQQTGTQLEAPPKSHSSVDIESASAFTQRFDPELFGPESRPTPPSGLSFSERHPAIQVPAQLPPSTDPMHGRGVEPPPILRAGSDFRGVNKPALGFAGPQPNWNYAGKSGEPIAPLIVEGDAPISFSSLDLSAPKIPRDISPQGSLIQTGESSSAHELSDMSRARTAQSSPTVPPPNASGQSPGNHTHSGQAQAISNQELLSRPAIFPASQRTAAQPSRPRPEVTLESFGSRAEPAPGVEWPSAEKSIQNTAQVLTPAELNASPARPKDPIRLLAHAIRERFSGALAFENEAGIRRVVLRDGDIVTAASSIHNETLLAFLIAKGQLPATLEPKLARRLPPFGRHAGAALIAHGHLQQDELWPVLRAHAEWVIGLALSTAQLSAELEGNIPDRLEAEPAVFGGATGAEIFIEVIRRALSPDEATRRLGGPRSRLVSGTKTHLLAECALTEAEAQLVLRAQSTPLDELVQLASTQDFAATLFALVELGVLDALGPGAEEEALGAPKADPLDDAALRKRIQARRRLVDEADYFALLGLQRNATAYDIRRAYLELRRAFEPSQVLSPSTLDLADDVRLIVEVLDEAFEVLRDDVRRERYRKAISSNP